MAKKAATRAVIIRGPYHEHDSSLYASPQSYADSMTDQSQAEACDINNILAHHQVTGVFDHVAKYEPWYGEASGDDYYTSMTLIATAESMFNDLPSEARSSFDNDPGKFLDFVRQDLSTPENVDRLCELGMIEPGSETYQSFQAAKRRAELNPPSPDQVEPPMVPDPSPPSE